MRLCAISRIFEGREAIHCVRHRCRFIPFHIGKIILGMLMEVLVRLVVKCFTFLLPILIVLIVLIAVVVFMVACPLYRRQGGGTMILAFHMI